VAIGAADYVWSEDWETFNGHSYKFFYDKHSSANDANRLCRTMGAMLVSINSADEMTFLGRRVLRKRTLSAFIGGTRDSAGVYTLQGDSKK